MMFMNEWEIEEAAQRFVTHPVLGPATQTLSNLRHSVNSMSDGWCYWPKPVRAAARLIELIEGDRSWDARYGEREEVTEAQLKKAYVPIKAFCTRHNITLDIVYPKGAN